MHLPWKIYLIRGIIIAIHAAVMAMLFFPDLSARMPWNKVASQETPAPEIDPTPVPSPEPPQPVTPAQKPQKPETPKPSTPEVKKPETPAQKPQKPETPKPSTPEGKKPETPKPSTQAPQMTATGKLNQITPYRQGYYKLGVKPLPAKLAKETEVVRSGVLIDLASHTILWEKASAKPYPIASLTKMLTGLALLQKIEATQGLSITTTVKVTREDFDYIKSHKMGNGALLEANDVFTLQDYLKCMVISSTNDAAYIIGKFLGDGDIVKGVKVLNEKAKSLGLNDMQFYTPNGLPAQQDGKRVENQGSALDVAFLGECVMNAPEYMKWAGTRQDHIVHHRKNQTDLNATNHLLRDRVPGVNGLKTGYTDGAGHCIAVSCVRNDRPILLVIMGVPATGDKGKHRDEIAKQLLDWAYLQTAN